MLDGGDGQTQTEWKQRRLARAAGGRLFDFMKSLKTSSRIWAWIQQALHVKVAAGHLLATPLPPTPDWESVVGDR